MQPQQRSTQKSSRFALWYKPGNFKRLTSTVIMLQLCTGMNENFVSSLGSILRDKHTIKVGEPDYPIAAVERGKAVLVGLNEKIVVGDHDLTKFSITPQCRFPC